MKFNTVKELLSDKNRWTQHYTARDEASRGVSVESPTACRFCALGAALKVYGSGTLEYANAVAKLDAAAKVVAKRHGCTGVVDPSPIIDINDKYGYDYVMEAVEEAGV